MERIPCKKISASYEAPTIRFDLGPIRDEINRVCNDYHEANRTNDVDAMEILDQIGPRLLDEFERTESQRALNPPWRRRVMRAAWHNARAEYELALEYEQEGYRYATQAPDGVHPETASRMQSISASNIADELMRLGRSIEAVAWAEESIALWQENLINYEVYAIALHHAGRPEAGDRIFTQLLALVDPRSRRDALAACIVYEHEMRRIESDAARTLLAEALSR